MVISVKRIWIIILIGLFLAGCQAQSMYPSLFENPVCQPPCWKGITPGFTTKAKSIVILSKVNGISQPIVDDHFTYAGFDDALHFVVNQSTIGHLYILDDRVSMLALESRSNLTLQKAIELFGQPQNILYVHAGEFDAITLLNSSKGISFGYQFHIEDQPEITPDTIIGFVCFFDPTKYQLLLDAGTFSYYQLNAYDTQKNLRPWVGYGSILRYATPLAP